METAPGVPFGVGEQALLLDREGNAHHVRLAAGATLHSHLGAVAHDAVIGLAEGDLVRSQLGAMFVAVRPRLLDFVFNGLERRSGIVYPKDAAQLLMWGDIHAGLAVLEAGVGSGALTLALLRAVGERGRLVGYEQRADFLELAARNVRAFLGAARVEPLLLRERNVYDGILEEDAGLDRVVLDLAEPWRVLPHLAGRLRPGGLVCAYTPSVTQASQLVEALRAAGRFQQVEVQEVLLRGWHMRGAAVRPIQQMVGHTGFLTVARFVAEGAGERSG